MSQRLWTPLHGWLGKLGLCKPSRPSKIQCGKLKSPVSLCSGLSQLDREEGEWRFFSFTTWRFLKCHNQQFPPPHTLLLQFLFLTLSIFLLLLSVAPAPLNLTSPFLFCFVKCCIQSSLSWHTRPLFIMYLRSRIPQTDRLRLNSSHRGVRKRETSPLINLQWGDQRKPRHKFDLKIKKGGSIFWWECVNMCACVLEKQPMCAC